MGSAQAADEGSVSEEVLLPDTEGADEGEVYVLPEAEVSAEQDTPERITREEMDRDGARDLWEAVQYTPGIVLSGGGRRNDSNFTVRGYGPDSVPVYVDGVPLANPYRGEGDSARILTGDLESIEIKKGYSSELLGANTLGGAILMRTAKPKEPFEASLKSVFGLDSLGHRANESYVFNLGTKQEYFYLRGVFQYRGVDHYRLAADFVPSDNNPQKEGNRLWSDSEDIKLTLMAGWTPMRQIDVWLSYTYQWADKGLSPPDTNTREYGIWDWPVWNRWSVSLNGDFEIGDFLFRGLFYFDKYDNRLDEYYTLKALDLGIHAPHSDYDEYSLGGRITGSWNITDKHNVQAAITYKKEDHQGLRGTIVDDDELNKEIQVNEDTWSAGAEYTAKLFNYFTLKAGFGFDALVPLKYWNQENEFLQLLEAEYFIIKTRNMFLYNWQGGIFYKPSRNHEIRLTYARKNHFPSMSARYSTRFGRTLPNPNLGPEKANHFELGYRGYFSDFLLLNTAIYFSQIYGKIVTVQLPNPHYPSALVDYDRNLDKTSFWGVELAPKFTITDWLNVGLAFTYSNYTINNSYNGIKVLTYYPQFTCNGYLLIKIIDIFSIIPRFEYIGPRYTDSNGDEKLDGHFLGNLKINAELGKHLEISAGVENIFDTYYEIRRNSPMAGRSFNISTTIRY